MLELITNQSFAIYLARLVDFQLLAVEVSKFLCFLDELLFVFLFTFFVVDWLDSWYIPSHERSILSVDTVFPKNEDKVSALSSLILMCLPPKAKLLSHFLRHDHRAFVSLSILHTCRLNSLLRSSQACYQNKK